MADDDLPLSSLAGLNEDLPLAALAKTPTAPSKVSKPNSSPATKPGAKAAPKAAPKAAGKEDPAKAKAKAKAGTAVGGKRKDNNSSSSSSSSSSGSDSEEENARPAKKKAMAVKRKRATEGAKEDGDEDAEEQANHKVAARNRTQKQQAVAELLCRWWYALPMWPPVDEAYYEAELARRNLRKVSIQKWEWVAEQDEKGRRKVYELSQFKGLFRTSAGDIVDTRPKDTCPCFSNYMKKELHELYDLIVKAYEGQLKDLKTSKYNEERFTKEVELSLKKARDRSYQAKQTSSVKPVRRISGS